MNSPANSSTNNSTTSEMNMEAARLNMIEQQIRPWNILDQLSLHNLKEIPRENFVPSSYKQLAFSDIEIPLAHKQCMLAPKIEAHILQAVQVKKTDQVLEVGTGTGYLTALLANKAKQVTSLEYHADLTEQARKNLSTHGINNVQLETRDAAQGYASALSFDIIIISGGIPEVSLDYKKLLSHGGRLFAITGESPVMSARLITRVADNQWSDVILFETDIPMLENTQTKDKFSF